MMYRGVEPLRLAQLALAAFLCTGVAACGGQGASGSTAAVANNPAGSAAASSASSATASTKAVTLSWSPPTENSDGSSLTNLAGYILHYGTASQDYTGSIEITAPTETSYVVSGSNFPPGTYYFAISAYNAQQVSSSMSGEVSVTVD